MKVSMAGDTHGASPSVSSGSCGPGSRGFLPGPPSEPRTARLPDKHRRYIAPLLLLLHYATAADSPPLPPAHASHTDYILYEEVTQLASDRKPNSIQLVRAGILRDD